MACFTAPLVESVIVTAVTKAEEKKEMQHAEGSDNKTGKVTIPLSRRLKWLSGMLYGGSALLAFEHVCRLPPHRLARQSSLSGLSLCRQ